MASLLDRYLGVTLASACGGMAGRLHEPGALPECAAR